MQGPLLCNGWMAVVPMYSKHLLLLRYSPIYSTWVRGEGAGERKCYAIQL